jgi:hypothetical protein
MTTDILIAGLMVLGSIASLALIMTVIARAVREEPRQVETRETVAVLRPTPGW